MLLVSRVENADMFALYFLSKPSSIYDKDNPDWAPSQKLGYDCNKVKESSQDICYPQNLFSSELKLGYIVNCHSGE